jgi:hypothetical protein
MVNRCQASLASVLVFTACAQTQTLTAELSPGMLGPHAVGYRVTRIDDTTRPFGSHPTRPMQISLWYPAHAGTGTELRFGDYMAQIATEGQPSAFRDDGAAEKGMQEFTAFYSSIGASRPTLDSTYRLAVPARRDAVPLGKDAPVIVFAVGINESPAQHTALAEFLATHVGLVS